MRKLLRLIILTLVFAIMCTQAVCYAHNTLNCKCGRVAQIISSDKFKIAVFALVIIFVFVIIILCTKLIKKSSSNKKQINNNISSEQNNQIIQDILNGLKNNEFKMYLQFVVSNKTKAIVSAEALSRWHTKENGVTGPGIYIKNMEDAGLISEHDFYMFELVCKQLEQWNNTKYSNITISCNFTRITLSEDDFINKLTQIFEKYNFDKSKLAIEITEDVIEKDIVTLADNVRHCKELGFKLYLDDMGSGYTTLSNLCDYPIDVVKIDRDILLKTNTERGRNLFDGIIALAHSLNTDVICEGVETESQNKLVSFSSCDYIQGWYYSKPIPSYESEEFIDNYKI